MQSMHLSTRRLNKENFAISEYIAPKGQIKRHQNLFVINTRPQITIKKISVTEKTPLSEIKIAQENYNNVLSNPKIYE